MKMVAEYLDHALQFERLAAEAEDAAFKEALLKQAAAYRKLAAERAAATKQAPQDRHQAHQPRGT